MGPAVPCYHTPPTPQKIATSLRNYGTRVFVNYPPWALTFITAER